MSSLVINNISQLNSQSTKENRLSRACTTAKKIFLYMIGTACDLALLPGAGIFALYAVCANSNFDPKIHQVKKDQTPILFIHGNGFNEMQWVVGRRLLAKDKMLGSMFSLNLDGLVTNQSANGIDDYAQKVAGKVEEIKKLTSRNDIILIGHSMGGLVASYFTEYLSQDRGTKVDRIIAISTPWSGSTTLKRLTKLTASWAPNIFKNPKRYKQMRDEDNFLETLRNKARSNGTTTYYCLYSTADGFVSGDSGKLEEDPNRTRTYQWMGHYTPMVSFSAWKQIRSWLILKLENL